MRNTCRKLCVRKVTRTCHNIIDNEFCNVYVLRFSDGAGGAYLRPDGPKVFVSAAATNCSRFRWNRAVRSPHHTEFKMPFLIKHSILLYLMLLQSGMKWLNEPPAVATILNSRDLNEAAVLRAVCSYLGSIAIPTPHIIMQALDHCQVRPMLTKSHTLATSICEFCAGSRAV